MKLLVACLLVVALSSCATLFKNPCANMQGDQLKTCEDDQAAMQQQRELRFSRPDMRPNSHGDIR
jgi:hypothetical protein